MHTAEPFVPEPSCFDVQIVFKKLKRYKSLDTDQILTESIQAGGSTLCPEMQKLINSVLNKEELPHQWNEVIKLTVHIQFYLRFLPRGYLRTCTELLGIISADFGVTDKLLIRHSAFVRYW
jgi:predicted AlkP superfamily pyrophosphatase or phosphodiesterase